jgi:hypothetical protein
MLFYSSPSVEIGAGSGFSVSVLVLSSAANNIEEKTIEKITNKALNIFISFKKKLKYELIYFPGSVIQVEL